MTRPHRDPAGLASALAIVGALFWLAQSCTPLSAAPYVQQVAAPAFYSPVQYAIGQQQQLEAAATYQFRQSDEYLELVRLRGVVEGVRLAVRQGESEGAGPRGQGPGEREESQAAADPRPLTPDPFAERFPTLAARCAKCHAGDEAKGDVRLDGAAPLDAETLVAAARAMASGAMPKGKPLEDQELFDALLELFDQ